MTRRLVAFTSLLAFLAGCGGAVTEGGRVTTTAPEIATTDGADAGEVTTTLPSDESTGSSGRPTAPDFTLVLGDGGSFTLSDGEKPVYLVFWAEW